MGREIFIYYRVDAADEPALRSQVRQLQAELGGRHPGLEARFFVRLDPAAGEARTFMETYRRAGGVDEACQAAITAAAAAVLDPLLRSPRRTEVFLPCG